MVRKVIQFILMSNLIYYNYAIASIHPAGLVKVMRLITQSADEAAIKTITQLMTTNAERYGIQALMQTSGTSTKQQMLAMISAIGDDHHRLLFIRDMLQVDQVKSLVLNQAKVYPDGSEILEKFLQNKLRNKSGGESKEITQEYISLARSLSINHNINQYLQASFSQGKLLNLTLDEVQPYAKLYNHYKSIGSEQSHVVESRLLRFLMEKASDDYVGFDLNGPWLKRKLKSYNLTIEKSFTGDKSHLAIDWRFVQVSRKDYYSRNFDNIDDLVRLLVSDDHRYTNLFDLIIGNKFQKNSQRFEAIKYLLNENTPIDNMLLFDHYLIIKHKDESMGRLVLAFNEKEHSEGKSIYTLMKIYGDGPGGLLAPEVASSGIITSALDGFVKKNSHIVELDYVELDLSDEIFDIVAISRIVNKFIAGKSLADDDLRFIWGLNNELLDELITSQSHYLRPIERIRAMRSEAQDIRALVSSQGELKGDIAEVIFNRQIVAVSEEEPAIDIYEKFISHVDKNTLKLLPDTKTYVFVASPSGHGKRTIVLPHIDKEDNVAIRYFIEDGYRGDISFVGTESNVGSGIPANIEITFGASYQGNIDFHSQQAIRKLKLADNHIGKLKFRESVLNKSNFEMGTSFQGKLEFENMRILEGLILPHSFNGEITASVDNSIYASPVAINREINNALVTHDTKLIKEGSRNLSEGFFRHWMILQ